MNEGHREAGHSDDCRTRVEGTMRGDPAQRQRLDVADRRRDKYLAREVEREVEPALAQEKPQEESGQGENIAAEDKGYQDAAAEEGEEGHEFGLAQAEEEPAAKGARVGSRDGPIQEREEGS